MSLLDANKNRVHRHHNKHAIALVSDDKEPTKRVNVQLPETMHAEFKARCNLEKTDMSAVVTRMIEEYLKEKPTPKRR